MSNLFIIVTWIYGSGALPGLILDLELLEIIWGGVFPISSPFGGL